jgi:tetratricopeptide (TPR) repeat protein
VITSRNPAWHEVAEPVGMPALDEDAAVTMLLDRTGQTDRVAAGRLVEALGYLPLALEQAGSYAAQHNLSLADYQALFQQRRTDLLGREAPLAYQGTVAATVTLAIDQLPTDPPTSRWLLEVCALLAPDQLPISRLLSRSDLLPHLIQVATADPLVRAEATRVLYQAGLLTPDVDGTARLHRLIQVVVLDTLTDCDRSQRLTETVHLLKGLFPDEPTEPISWSNCADLVAHVSAVLDQFPPVGSADEALARLVTMAGTYLMARRADLDSASRLYERALAILERLYAGADHPALARSLAMLAAAVYQQGKYQQARELAERALAMRERLYAGTDHPDLAYSLDMLASILHQQRKYKQARRELVERALAMRERLYGGTDHRTLARSLDVLGTTLSDQGKFVQARRVRKRARAMRTRLAESRSGEVSEGPRGHRR